MPFYFGLDITDFNNYNDTMFIIRYNQKSKKYDFLAEEEIKVKDKEYDHNICAFF